MPQLMPQPNYIIVPQTGPSMLAWAYGVVVGMAVGGDETDGDSALRRDFPPVL